MFRNKLSIIILLVLIGLGLPQGNQTVLADELRIPVEKSVNDTITSGPSGNLYIAPSDRQNIANDRLFIDEGEASVLFYQDYERILSDTGLEENDEFALFNNQGLYQIWNETIDGLSVMADSTFLDIFSSGEQEYNNTNLLENLLLLEDESYPFIFNVGPDEVNQPLVISTDLRAPSAFVDIDFRLLQPGDDAEIVYNLWSTPTDDELLIPLFPSKSGLHILTIVPRSDDVILDQLAILDGFDVEEVESGRTFSLQGTESRALFYEFEPPIVSHFVDDDFTSDMPFPGRADFNSFVDHGRIVQDRTLEEALQGSAEIRVHTPGDPFGRVDPQDVMHTGNTFFSIIVNPPDDDNPTIRAEKEKLGLPDGYDLDVAFWGNFRPAEILNPGEDLIIRDGNEDGIFYLFTNETFIVSLNDTATNEFGGPIQTDALFTNLETNEFFVFNARDNDLRNFEDVNLESIPPGGYLLEVFAADGTEIRFDFLPIDVMAQDTIDVIVGTDEIKIIEIGANDFNIDFYNITLTNGEDYSLSVDVDVFDSEGNFVQRTALDFDNVNNFNNSEFLVNVDQAMPGQYNLRGGYLRLRQTSNTLWNNSLFDPLAGSPILINGPYNATLHILRSSNIDMLARANPNSEYFYRGSFVNRTISLNASKDMIVEYYQYDSFAGGNQLRFQLTNMSFQVMLVTDATSTWFDQAANVVNINGTFQYSLSLEFGTLESLPFGIVIIIDPSANGNLNDSSLETSFITSPFYRFPELPLSHMSFTSISGDTIDQDALTTITPAAGEFPALTAIKVGAAVIGTAGVAAYFAKSRGLSIGNFGRKFRREEN